MTSEEKRQYAREYREKNRERIKEQRMNRIRMKALEDLQSIREQDTNVYIFKAHNEREYIVGGWKR